MEKLKFQWRQVKYKIRPYSRFHFVNVHSLKLVKYNLNFDDLLPDFRNFYLLAKLVRVFPEIKINIALPIASRDLSNNNNIFDYPQWLVVVRQLSRSKNFEFSPHGYYHTTVINGKEVPEFKFVTKEQGRSLILKCERALNQAGIKFVRGFRPPRWEISQTGIEALISLGYLYLSDTPRFYDQHFNLKMPRIFSNSDIRHNEDYIDITLYRHLLSPDPARYYIQRGHISPVSDNYLTSRTTDNIIRTVKLLQSFKQVEFRFLSEIAQEISK